MDEIDGDSLGFLQACVHNQDLPVSMRLSAAKPAVQYEKPKLQAIAHLIEGPKNMGELLDAARAMKERMTVEIDGRLVRRPLMIEAKPIKEREAEASLDQD
jgi:hypothetical protein